MVYWIVIVISVIITAALLWLGYAAFNLIDAIHHLAAAIEGESEADFGDTTPAVRLLDPNS